MRILIAITIVAAVASVVEGCSPKSKSAGPVSSSKVDELSALPDGLTVVHAPNPVPAVRQGRSGRAYTWLYSTTVTAPDDTIEIVEFGAFGWHNGQWVFSTIYDRPFNAEEFAEWYSCPSSIIAQGQAATDPNNYTGADELLSSKTKWYFIGKNSKGTKVKGEAVVEHLAEVKE